MHGDPSAAPDTDGTDLSFAAWFFRIYPYTRFTRRPSGDDPIFSECKDRHFFDLTQVFADIRLKFLQVKDRITDDLLRSMKRDIPATVCVKKLNTPGRPHLFIDQHIFDITA